METDLRKLKEPFGAQDLEWRVQSAGKSGGGYWALVVPYVTVRAIQDRLDEVVGPEHWRNEFQPAPSGQGVVCGISLRIGGEWITKWDGAENTQVEAIKGGLSGAMKRAAVQWGIGRYLYRLDEGFAVVSDRGAHRFSGQVKNSGGQKEHAVFRWNPPSLPAWALPEGDRADARADDRADDGADARAHARTDGRTDDRADDRADARQAAAGLPSGGSAPAADQGAPVLAAQTKGKPPATPQQVAKLRALLIKNFPELKQHITSLVDKANDWRERAKLPQVSRLEQFSEDEALAAIKALERAGQPSGQPGQPAAKR